MKGVKHDVVLFHVRLTVILLLAACRPVAGSVAVTRQTAVGLDELEQPTPEIVLFQMGFCSVELLTLIPLSPET